jgi:hypothetical protein
VTGVQTCALPIFLSEWHEPVISIEKDMTHFEILPRIPVAPSMAMNMNSTINNTNNVPSFTMSTQIQGNNQFNSSNLLNLQSNLYFNLSSHYSNYSTNFSNKYHHSINHNHNTTSLTALPTTIEQVELCSSLIHFSKNGSLLFSAGHIDGSIYIREIDNKTGFIISSGDFLGHQHKVVSLSSDFIFGSRVDSMGQLFLFMLAQSTMT